MDCSKKILLKENADHKKTEDEEWTQNLLDSLTSLVIAEPEQIFRQSNGEITPKFTREELMLLTRKKTPQQE